MINKTVFIIFISITFGVEAQTSKICGKLNTKCDDTKELILFNENNSYKQLTQKDSVFCFDSIQNGTYNLKVYVNTRNCYIRPVLIRSINANDTLLHLGQLPLFNVTTSDRGILINRNGNDTLYYNSGKIESIGKYKKIKINKEKNFYKVGKWSYFSEKGYLYSEEFYFDIRQYYDIIYYENGIIKVQGERHNDYPVGKWNYYNENGNRLFSVYHRGISYEIDFSDLEKFVLYHNLLKIW